MTRPAEVKVREGTTPGTPFAEFVPGAQLRDVRFDITPDIIDEYFEATGEHKADYRLGERFAAPPTVILVYMTAVLYQTYPPIQGIVMCEVNMDFHRPIWADESTSITASGRILEKFEKNSRRFVTWEAIFLDADDNLVTSLVNTFSVPE